MCHEKLAKSARVSFVGQDQLLVPAVVTAKSQWKTLRLLLPTKLINPNIHVNGGDDVYKVNSDGTGYTVLHSFSGGIGTGFPGDEQYPAGELRLGKDGTLYGTDEYGGSNFYGTIYKLNIDGSGFSDVYSLGATPQDGQVPYGPLLLGNDGLWYGTTYSGGRMGCGTIFRLVPVPQFNSFNLLPNNKLQFSIWTVSNLTSH